MRLDHLRILGRRLRKIPTARIEQTSLNQQLLNKRALLLFGPLGFLAPVGFRLGRDDASGSPFTDSTAARVPRLNVSARTKARTRVEMFDIMQKGVGFRGWCRRR